MKKSRFFSTAILLSIPAFLLASIAMSRRKSTRPLPSVPRQKVKIRQHDLMGVWRFQDELSANAMGYVYFTAKGRCYVSVRPSPMYDDGRWHFFSESDYQLKGNTIIYTKGINYVISGKTRGIPPRDPRTTPPTPSKEVEKIIDWNSHVGTMKIESLPQGYLTPIVGTLTKVNESEFPDKNYVK